MANEEFLHTNLLYRLVDRLMVLLDVLLARVVTLLDDPGTLAIMLLGIALSCAVFAWAFGTLFLHLNRSRRPPARAARTAQPARSAPSTKPAKPARPVKPVKATRATQPAGGKKRRRRVEAPRSPLPFR